MKILGLVETLEGLPEDIKKHYTPTEDGKFIADISGLSSALERQKEESKKIKEANQSYQSKIQEVEGVYAGVDLVEYNELKTLKSNMAVEKAKLEEAAAIKAGDFEKVKLGIMNEYEAKLQAQQTQINEYDSKFESLVLGQAKSGVQSELNQLYSANGIDKPYMVEHYVKSRVQTSRVNGEIQTVILDELGKPLEPKYNAQTAKMENVTLADLVKGIASDDKWAHALKPNNMRGPDTSGGDNGADKGIGRTGKQITQDELQALYKTDIEKLREIKSQIKKGLVEVID